MWKPTRGNQSSPTKLNEQLVEAVLHTTQSFLTQQGIERELSLDILLAEPGLGLDSLQRMDLLAEIEKACSVTIPEPLWGDQPVTSLRHLLESLHP